MPPIRLLHLSLLSWALYTLAAPSTTSPIVDVGYAQYMGNQSYPNTVAYLGIPYAEPPLGDLRFRAPVPLNTTRVAQSSKGEFIDATNYSDFCVQGKINVTDHGGAGSEDCLKVNIYAPTGAKEGQNLPVLVYIHGGGYIYGNPQQWPFDHWVQQSPNVVIVSVYYRLSSFGFLALPEFQSDPSLGDLNAGFKDQIEALKWIKRHIHYFGGNPRQVTINGESAGGAAVELHLVANEDEKLFSGAIVQSAFRPPVPLPEQQRPLFEFYAQEAGCGNGTTAEKMTCLRQAPISALAIAQDNANSPAFNGSLYKTFHVVVDEQIITDYPTRSITSGKFVEVPLIVGSTTNETLARGSNDTHEALELYFPEIQSSDLDELDKLYPESDFASSSLLQETLTGDVSVRCTRAIMGQNFSKRVNTWTYRYNQRNPTLPGLGVAHAAENWMMFRGVNTGVNGSAVLTPMTPVENAFAEELLAYWLSFVRSHDPNTYKLDRSPSWPKYSVDDRTRLVLKQDPKNTTSNTGSFLEKEVDPETSRCTAIGAQSMVQQN